MSEDFSLGRELQHLVQQTLLIQHVAGGVAACLCDITIYLLFWILFELGWKDQEKVCTGRHILTPFFFFSSFRLTKWLDIVFYTSACLVGFNQLQERARESTVFPQGYACRGQKTSISQLMPYTSDLCCYDMVLSNDLNRRRIEWREAFSRKRTVNFGSSALVMSVFKDAFTNRRMDLSCRLKSDLKFTFKNINICVFNVRSVMFSYWSKGKQLKNVFWSTA